MTVDLKKRVLNLENANQVKSSQHIIFLPGETQIHSTNEMGKKQNRLYIPSRTGLEFEQDDSFVQLVMGPYGSGKTTMCLQKIVKKACDMPVWHNGRRRSRWIIIRNTSPELHSTTLKSWMSWFSELGDIRQRQKPVLTLEHTFNDGNGVIELELMFIALDRDDDIRKLKSLEATGAYINELSEVPQGVLSHLKGRLNHRYPSRAFCSEYYWSGVFCDTNPPDEDHWIYRDFDLKPVEGYKIFKQPPGLIKVDDVWEDNREADNAINLAHPDRSDRNKLIYDYYSKLASGQSEEFIKVYCLGQYGIVGLGKKVYPEYNDDIHSRDTIDAIQGEPLHLGWDGGLTPACIVIQMTSRGQMLVLKEYTAEDMGARTFAESVVIPFIQKDFPYNPIISPYEGATNCLGLSRADPSCVQRDQIVAEFSFIGELNSVGIPTIPASTNKIDTRISAVRFFLNRMSDGKPCFLLSRRGCPILRKGFAKDYVYKRIAVSGDERYKDTPDKGMSSHPHDALQYIALEFASDRISKENIKKQPNMYNPVMRF